MTIAEYAVEMGVSRQTVYKWLAKEGVTPDSAKDPETGELTPEALHLLSNGRRKPGEKRDTKGTQENAIAERVAALTSQVEELQAEVTRLRERVAELQGERDFLRATLATSQETCANLTARLALPEPEARRTLWQRLTGRK